MTMTKEGRVEPTMQRRLRVLVRTTTALFLAVSLIAAAGGCGKKKPPVARPAPPPPAAQASPSRPPAPPEPVAEPTIVPPEPVKEDAIASASLDDLNRNSPLRPVFFAYDSAEIDADGQAALQADAGLLKKYPSWSVTVEGHCDERGTA